MATDETRAERCRRLEREAHLWLAYPDELDRARVDLLYRRVLNEPERERADRQLRARGRVQSIVGHALVRLCLSRYREVHPAAWCFRAREGGRPEIDPPDPHGLRFNLSHADGLAACVVTHGIACGVDVERIHRSAQRLRRAARLLSPEEATALEALPEADRPVRFFALWTLREACLKACGAGLFSEEAERIRVQASADGTASMGNARPSTDGASPWQLCWSRPTQHHVMAVALERSGTPRRVVTMDCSLDPVPLA